MRADSAAKALFDHLVQLPDNRSRASAIKRLIFKAIYTCRPSNQEKPTGPLHAQAEESAIPNSYAASSITHLPTTLAGGTDSTALPPAIAGAHPAPQPAAISPVPNSAQRDANLPPQAQRRRLRVNEMLAALDHK